MLLEFEHVTGRNRRFGLQDVSFALPAGYIMGLAGKNGAGKSTLIDYIVNPKVQYSGTIRINGVDIREDFTTIKNQIGLISEQNLFFEERTPRQNGELMGRFYDNWDKEVFHAQLTKMEVPEGRSVGKLSRGENFRFQMAFAMAHKPSIYLLDEVTAGMDPVFRLEFFKVLQGEIATEQASVLITSHIASEIEHKMDYVGILENGKLISFSENVG